MSFDNDHPGRKDQRKPCRKSKRWDRSCRNHGSCGYCQGNREHSKKQREEAAFDRWANGNQYGAFNSDED
jgi:hypothetical protein